MADWLAYGLDEALAETPEIGVIRKHKAFSGLIRYEAKPDAAEWPQIARELIAAEKPQAVIMMIGVQDRQAMREKIVAKPVEAKPAEQKPAEQKPGEQKPGAQKPADQKPGAQKPDAQKADAPKKPASPDDDEQQPNIAAPEPQRGARPAGGLHEYHTEKWEELYAKRIDETIAALKSANIPVLWVGLPSIRGQKSTADALYLNEFYRARVGSRRHSLCRCLGRLRGRAGALLDPRAGLRRPDAPPARRRRRAFHEIRRAQARALCRARIAPRAERDAGRADDAGARAASRASRTARETGGARAASARRSGLHADHECRRVR